MTADPDCTDELMRICEILRSVEVPEDKIAAFSQRWLQSAPSAAAPRAKDESPEVRLTAGGIKHPNVRVRLRDLDNKLGPVLRRVSYALSDAGVSDEEIERYKAEVRAGDPSKVSRRWVGVDD
jgi:hypothetical protein